MNRGKESKPVKTVKRSGAASREVFLIQEESAAFLLWDVSLRMRRIFEKRILRQGLNLGHWRFLRELWEQDGLTQAQLAERARMRGPSALMAVRGLEEQGLVHRVPNKSDLRKINVFLTKSGREMYRRVEPELKFIHDTVFGGLPSDQIEALKMILRKVRTHLGERSM